MEYSIRLQSSQLYPVNQRSELLRDDWGSTKRSSCSSTISNIDEDGRAKEVSITSFSAISFFIFIFLCLRSVKFGFLLKGEYIGASAVLNMHTKFAKL